MEFDSLPSRGQTGKPGSPDAKFESTKFKKNQRSANSISWRRQKRRIFRKKCRQLHSSARREFRKHYPAEIKSKMASLRMDRRSSALDRLSNDVPRTDGNNTTTDNPVPVAASRDSQLPLLKLKPLRTSLLSPRHFTFLASFNCRTLLAQWRRYELVNYCAVHRIMVLSIQEHRIFFEPSNGDPFRREQLGGGWWFIYSSASPAGVGGVGFIFSPKAFKDVCGVQFISSRIISVKLGNVSAFKSCIYSVYSPTSASDLDTITQFYDELTNSLDPIPLSWLTIIMGDFNAPLLPSPSVPYSTNVKENRNTPLFEEFLSRTDFKPVNTLFRKHRSQLLSFYGPNKRRVTLDYILLRPK